ncbi:MAG: ribosome biogenesis GTP-binding protein YihA/YsxC [Christensenellales bacterium]
MKIKKAVFLTSVGSASKLPETGLKEIAVIGRSNVGKSSFINTIANNKKLAKVGGTPGKTRLVNYFIFNDEFCLVDLPGYGYARVSKEEKQRWGDLIEGYLKTSSQLKHIILLADIRRTPNEDDKLMVDWMRSFGYPFTVAATKADKISRARRAERLHDIEKTLGADKKPIAFSAADATGKEEILKAMADVLEIDTNRFN